MTHRPRPAPNYTTPALVMAFVNLFWILVAIWVIWGWPAVLTLAAALKWGIDRIGARA